MNEPTARTRTELARLRRNYMMEGYSIPRPMGVENSVDPFARRYQITNLEEYQRVMLNLGVIKEVKR
jgi:hypothetical protein